jgi:hypothetical protein
LQYILAKRHSPTLAHYLSIEKRLPWLRKPAPAILRDEEGQYVHPKEMMMMMMMAMATSTRLEFHLQGDCGARSQLEQYIH